MKLLQRAQGYKGDVYEIVPEYVFLNYSTQLIKTGFYLKLSATRKNKLKEANYIAYEKLLRKIVEIDYKSNKYMALKGIQHDTKRYPIYALYDLQVCMLELLEASNTKSIMKKTHNISNKAFLFVGVAAIGATIISAIRVDVKNTVTSLLISGAGFTINEVKKRLRL